MRQLSAVTLLALCLLHLPFAIKGQPAGAPSPAGSSCAAGLTAALASVPARNLSNYSPTFVDPDTPATACTRTACTAPVATNACVSSNSPTTKLQLVFSDEFNTANRSFGYGSDARWLAMDMWYAPTGDKEVYKPSQINTTGGAAVITLANTSASANFQDPFGNISVAKQPYTSGMLQTWNKFCFTGGYVEARIKLPGDATKSGLWPAFWMFGNLGRAGMLNTTGGVWPYSYNQCDLSGPSGFDSQPGQLIDACPDPPGFNRTSAWGLNPGQGRGAPEIDIMELLVNTTAAAAAAPAAPAKPSVSAASLGSAPSPSTAVAAGQATVAQTLQMAPLAPNGTHWLDTAFYAAQNIADGAPISGAGTEFQTRVNPQWGPLSTPGDLPRPGSLYQDAIGAVNTINDTFLSDFHTFAVYWAPGEYVRFYIDDVFTFEVNKDALVPRINALGQRVGLRMIPEEPMYLLLNLAISDGWVAQDPKLTLPAQMEIDWVRVYQDPANLRLGCSPPDYPTAQYIACHAKQYILNPQDASLITGTCPAAAPAPASSAVAGRKLIEP